MHGTSFSIGANANCGAAEIRGEDRRNLRCDDAVVSVCQAIFPNKAALNIADLTGYPVRTVEYWFAGGKLPADALARMIRSEYGVRFLAAIMADAQPTWWRRLKSFVLSLDSLSGYRAAQRKLQEALNEDAQFKADYARTEATLSVRDEEFFSPHLDALRAAGPQPHRAVAQSTQKVKR